jgi:hypothetical protein
MEGEGVSVEPFAQGKGRRCREDMKSQGWMGRAVEYERQMGMASIALAIWNF